MASGSGCCLVKVVSLPFDRRPWYKALGESYSEVSLSTGRSGNSGSVIFDSTAGRLVGPQFI